jgi:hypothetical protein
LLGWQIRVANDDPQELQLEYVDNKDNVNKLSIARIVWTPSRADRDHLGQLSISQTKYWCERGTEPKGILVIARESNQEAPAPLSSDDLNSELAEYANKKNVCLMTTMQLLSIYKEAALHDAKIESLRATILNTSGWLKNFALEPGGEPYSEDESLSDQVDSLLSA